VFVQEEEELFRRFSETHYQKGYTVEQIVALLEQVGMNVVELRDADTEGEVTPESERVLVVAREQGKKGR
jgi:hypothetical protein